MLKYFMNCETLEELKSTYRNLVMKEQQSVTVNLRIYHNKPLCYIILIETVKKSL